MWIIYALVLLIIIPSTGCSFSSTNRETDQAKGHISLQDLPSGVRWQISEQGLDNQSNVQADATNTKEDAKKYETENKGPARPIASGKAVPMYYATTRQRSGQPGGPNSFYGTERIKKPNPVELGIVVVNIPPQHETGRSERPFSIFTVEFKEVAAKHVMLIGLNPGMKPDDYFASMRNDLQDHNQEAFVYIHGYWNSFADAARKTAQIAHDLKTEMVPIMFSWASQNTFYGYMDDGEAARDAVDYLYDFLWDLNTQTNVKKVHFIAHSMGNEVLIQALKALSTRSLPNGRIYPFHELVLAAPDVDEGIFFSAVKAAQKICVRITAYVASNDVAMIASHWLRSTSYRVGDSSPEPFVVAGVQTVDVSNANSDWLGHGYITSNRSVLQDLYSILEGKEVRKRFGILESKTSTGKIYWKFSP